MEAEAVPTTDIDRVQSSGGDEELAAPKQDVLLKVPFMADLEKPSVEHLSVASATNSTRKEEEEQEEDEERIKMAKGEMREVREENERLKKCLDEIIKDYETLKRQFHEMMMGSQRSASGSSIINNNDPEAAEEVDDMVSLTLGRFSSPHQNHKIINKDGPHQILDLKQHWGSPPRLINNVIQTPSSDHIPTTQPEPKEQDQPAHAWPPTKLLKASPPPPPSTATGEDEVSHHNPPKKARVCVRARCDTPTMNDGCQWRKYGQKIAKGNPCPRAYYRCTGAPSCPVRKQVQRSVDDISILITTYEGTHNHPLPVSAMAMASTTSAAASMLLSGPSSSTSRPGLNPSFSATATTGANLHGMNLYLSNTNSKQFYLPNSPMLSSSLNHPTITLDLTSNPPSTSSSSPFHKIPSTYPPKYPFTSLDFGSSQPNFMSLNNNSTTSYGNSNNQAYNIGKNAIGLASDFAKQLPLHGNIYQACLQQFSKSSTPPPQPLPDTIAAATKAITSDPSFQSALAAALTSIIGGGNGIETAPPMSSYVQALQGNVCASSLSSEQGSMGFQPPKSLTCSTSKSPSSSPGDSRDNDK